MPIFQAIGTGIFLLIISLIMSPVLSEFEAALVAMFRGARISAETAATIIGSAAASLPTP